MNILFFIVGIFLVVILVFWLGLFLFLNDFSIPTPSIKSIKKVLIIFPHPDDEVLSVGGLTSLFRNQKSEIILTVLTQGEKGNPKGEKDPSLKSVRKKEFDNVSKILGFSKTYLEDFGDGELIDKKEQLKKYLSDLISKENPDLVITYDKAGLYGHPDHVVVSDIVTDIVENKKITLWYPTYPGKVLRLLTLPEYMARDPEFKNLRKNPNIKFFIGSAIFKKIKAVYTYKSQYDSFRSSIPFKFIPLWYFHSITLFEYFYEVQ